VLASFPLRRSAFTKRWIENRVIDETNRRAAVAKKHVLKQLSR